MPKSESDERPSSADLLEAARERPELAEALFPGGLPISVEDDAFTDAALERAVRAGQRVAETSAESGKQSRGPVWSSSASADDLVTTMGPRRSRSVAQQYLRDVREQLDLRAAWPPNMSLEPGLVGQLKDDVFVPMAHLSNVGLTVPARLGFETADLRWGTRGRVQVEVGSPGERGQVIVRFSAEGAALVDLREVRTNQLDATRFPELQAALLDLERDGRWAPDWVLISEVLQARSAVILISGSNDARVVFERDLSAVVDTSATSVGLLHSARIVSSTGLATSLVTAAGCTPLFRAVSMRRNLFGGSPQLKLLPH